MDFIGAKDWAGAVARADASDWITVAAYLAAALLAGHAARLAQLRREGRERIFWSITAGLMVFLGINEVFDMQTILTAIGKVQAIEGGWYENRRPVQVIFIAALGLAALAAGLVMLWLTRGAHRSVRVALLGHVFIGAFVLLRAASFHHIDRLLGMGPSAFNIGSMQEMLGIAIIALAARAYSADAALRRR